VTAKAAVQYKYVRSIDSARSFTCLCHHVAAEDGASNRASEREVRVLLRRQRASARMLLQYVMLYSKTTHSR
jgi:hypothetical protein